ncbi:MAG: CDP-alcohol phosphatidyltransferase family protein [Polyangiaceae bacterium]
MLPPSLLSLARVPLAVAFLFALERPLIEAGILAAAGLTDVLDGWVARRNQQVTATGAVVDPITDKLFVLTVVLALVVTERLPLWRSECSSTREIGEAPLVVWWTFSRACR